MGCGCGGAKRTVKAVAPSGASTSPAAGAKMFDVFTSDGTLVASSQNPTFARIEARRTGGTVVPRTTVPAQ